jgi:hypothetical protein
MKNRLTESLCRPSQEHQMTLFPTTLKELLKELGLTRRELNEWNRRGWTVLTDAKAKADEPERFELAFLRDITRSGLRPDQVNLLLQSLEKPYAYNPQTILLSFMHGWVQLAPPPDPPSPSEVIGEHLDEWLSELAESGEAERLAEIAQTVTRLIPEALAVQRTEVPR